MRSLMNGLQPLGRALMLPIAVLPVAGLLLRLGQPDLLNIAFVSAAGEAIFNHLGLLFALGVATGFARDGNGAACLAGVVCFLVARNGAQTLISVPHAELSAYAGPVLDTMAAAWKDKAVAPLEVPIGILSGLAGGLLYNRFADIRLPGYLAFFGGRRFVPIVSGLFGLMLAALVGAGYTSIAWGIDALGHAVTGSGPLGLFAYGVANRLLLVTGLHHILNNIPWFVLGEYHGATGDLRRFFAGDPTAGGFMSGYFPVMIFGLPAACLAMYHTARPERRKAVGGMLMSMALTSALTGVTEPIEFSFMFLAPVLFAAHAVLTGVAMALMSLLHVHLGFGFSAGLLDYALNYGKATNPLLLLPVGVAYALVYYGVFRFVILRYNLATPGRDVETAATEGDAGDLSRGEAFVAALGGAANLESIGACTTRLRLIVMDGDKVDERSLKMLGAIGILRPSAKAIQIVLGPIADQVAMEMRQAGDASAIVADAPAKAPEVARDTEELPPAMVAALGGSDNIGHAAWFRGRLCARLKDPMAADGHELAALGFRQVTHSGGSVHLLFDPLTSAEGFRSAPVPEFRSP
jgi:PTS system N-acetylglucosamine-specific IIC component